MARYPGRRAYQSCGFRRQPQQAARVRVPLLRRSTAELVQPGDYGPLGGLKENIRRQWWQSVVRVVDDVVGLDLGHPGPAKVWRRRDTSAFVDPLTECKKSFTTTAGARTS